MSPAPFRPFIALALAGIARCAELTVVPSTSVVFAGKAVDIDVRVESSSPTPVNAGATVRIFQLTSTTAAPIGPAQPWKTLALLPRQRVIESLTLTLPEVRAVTAFRVEISVAGQSIGRQLVLACPPDLLKGAPLALHDPDARIAPALARLGASTTSYAPGDAATAGAAIVLGPYTSRAQVPTDLSALAAAGHGIIVLVPARELATATFGVIAIVPATPGKIIYADAARFAGLEASAAAQLDFFKLVQLALGREPLPFPDAGAR